MRIFVTGAPGFIGSALVPELIQAGHQVLGVTRSGAGAEKLQGAGAELLHGNIEDLESLRRGAADSDDVIHLAFNHDFSQFQKNADNDREAIVAIGEVLLGSNRPFVITSGTAIAANVDGKPSTEDSPPLPKPRVGSMKQSGRGAGERRLGQHCRRQQSLAGGARFRRSATVSSGLRESGAGRNLSRGRRGGCVDEGSR